MFHKTMKIAKVLIGETNLTIYNHLQPFIWEVYVDWLEVINHQTDDMWM